VKSIGIIIEELDEKSWSNAIKELIQLRDEKRENVLSQGVSELLNQVRRVFDPEGVLI